jgi:hypothetical protein
MKLLNMKLIKKILYHYFLGILFSLNIIAIVIFVDYYFNDYLFLPEIKNLLITCFISGISFGFTHFIYTKIQKIKNKN